MSRRDAAKLLAEYDAAKSSCWSLYAAHKALCGVDDDLAGDMLNRWTDQAAEVNRLAGRVIDAMARGCDGGE